MTSTWPVEDESGNTSTCTMVMNVDSTGITKILRFNSKESEGEGYILLSEEDKKLIKKNEELYIGNLSLCEAVEEFLGMQQSREEIIRMDGGKGCNSALSPGVVPVTNSSEGNVGSNPPALSSANSDTSTQTGVNSRGNGVQAETDLQQQKIDKLVQDNQEFRGKLDELSSILGGLVQNFEGLRDNEKCRNRLQNVRTVRLESKVGELEERVDKIFWGIGNKRKIKSFEPRIKKFCQRRTNHMDI